MRTPLDVRGQFVPAMGFLVYLSATGEGSFTTGGVGHALLIAVSGIVTAVPLIFFGSAAVRLPLSTVGLLQYLAPALMFVLGLTAFHEQIIDVSDQFAGGESGLMRIEHMLVEHHRHQFRGGLR